MQCLIITGPLGFVVKRLNKLVEIDKILQNVSDMSRTIKIYHFTKTTSIKMCKHSLTKIDLIK